MLSDSHVQHSHIQPRLYPAQPRPQSAAGDRPYSVVRSDSDSALGPVSFFRCTLRNIIIELSVSFKTALRFLLSQRRRCGNASLFTAIIAWLRCISLRANPPLMAEYLNSPAGQDPLYRTCPGVKQDISCFEYVATKSTPSKPGKEKNVANSRFSCTT